MKNRDDFFRFSSKEQKILYLGLLLGVIAAIFGLMTNAQRMWINYLTNSVYFVSLALGGGVVLAIASVTSSAWASPFKRLLESLTTFLPVGLLLMLGLYFGIHSLYEWSHHTIVEADAILRGKAIYLNTPFFMIRIIVFFSLWITTTSMMLFHSRKQDQDSQINHTFKIVKWSSIFLVTFAFSYSLASFDWLMSLRPHWFSTIFGIYNFSGLFVNTFAVVTFMTIWLSDRGYLKGMITDDVLHDLGKFLFGFTTFWAYIWLCQYLLIWYSNIPEETLYYIGREKNTWDWLFYSNLAINWAIPFISLMSRGSKRSRFTLIRVCVLLIIGRWLDLYLMISPDVNEIAGITNPEIGLIEIGMGIGFGCFFILFITRSLKRANLRAVNDPYLEEGIHLHQ